MLKVDTACMEAQAQKINKIAKQLDAIAGNVVNVNQRLRWNANVVGKVRQSVSSCSTAVSRMSDQAYQLSSALLDASNKYRQAEKVAANGYDETVTPFDGAANAVVDILQSFIDEFRSNYGWKEILAGAGYIGTIYDFINDIKNGKTWKDFTKTGLKIYEFMSGAITTYNNYKKIGNAVGVKTATTWWLKNITGLKPLGRASTAKNPFTRFANNLTNKTSPFHAQFQNVLDNFSGKNGVGKAAASWGAVVVNGVVNWFDNKKEQENSNGTMSDGRVWAETITETAVDTVLTYGAGIVVGAAITTVCGTVAAPGIVVVAASGALIAGVNAGVKALTGKSTTEWISDTILDTGLAIGKAAQNASDAIGDAAISAAKTVGKWFDKLAFA